jgi:hypothetical protein
MLLGGYPLVELIYAQQPANVNKSGWQQFTSSTGKFKVLMPGKPKQLKKTVPTPVGAIDIQIFSVDKSAKNAGYVVAYADFPINLTSINSTQFFDLVGNGLLGKFNGKLISQRNFQLQGFPGREFTYLYKNEIIVHRMYLVNQRLYQASVEMSKEKQKYLAKTNAGFFNSFKLL